MPQDPTLMSRPNILLLTIDSLRPDMLGCYGSPAGLTPNLDRLAASALLFRQAITGGSWTQAAFPVLLTSSYASWYGGCLGPLSPRRPSPIAALSAHGYHTLGFSTNPLLSREQGYARGFDSFSDLIPEERDPRLRRLKRGEWMLRLPTTHRLARALGARSRPARLYVSAEKVVDEVCRALGRAEAPFFIWAHFMDTHWPYHIEETLKEPGEIAQAWRDLVYMHRANRKGRALTAAERSRFRQLYQEALRFTDAQVGRVLSQLRESGLAEDTVILIVSDHGEELMERSHWGHFEINLYDEILRVPLLIYFPDSRGGERIERQVRTLDLMPTILDLCQCPLPTGIEGISLAPLWKGGAEAYSAPESISEMWRTHRHIIAVRTESRKYIWDSSQPELRQLFDLKRDPSERSNIAGDEPAEVARLQSIVDSHIRLGGRAGGDAEFVQVETDREVLRRLKDLGYLD